MFDYSIKKPGFMLFLGHVLTYSGQHPDDIDFEPLGLKSDHEEGGILGTEV